MRDDKTVTVRDERSEEAKRRQELCRAIVAEFLKSGTESAQISNVDEDPGTLVRGLRRVLLAHGMTEVYVVQRQGAVYIARK